jgi:hypothetical protein
MTPASLQPTPAFRPFRDVDSPLIRAATLLLDSDEWGETPHRIRVFRNGTHHFVMAEANHRGHVHPELSRLLPDLDAVPGTAVLIDLTTAQTDRLIEAIR